MKITLPTRENLAQEEARREGLHWEWLEKAAERCAELKTYYDKLVSDGQKGTLHDPALMTTAYQNMVEAEKMAACIQNWDHEQIVPFTPARFKAFWKRNIPSLERDV